MKLQTQVFMLYLQNYETSNIKEIKIIVQNNKMLNYFLPKVCVKIAEG